LHPAASIALWFIWGAVLLGAYYYQLWRLIASGQTASGWFASDAIDALLPVVLIGAVLLVLAIAFARLYHRSGARCTLLLWSIIGVTVLVLLPELDRLPGWGTLVTAAASMGLPSFGEAALRALRGVIGCVAVLAVAQVMGWAVMHLAGAPVLDSMESMLFRTATGLGAFAYVTLALATLHLYTVPALRVLVVALLLAGVAIMARAMPNIRMRQRPAIGIDTSAAPRSDFAWKTVTLFFLLIALLGALAPESEYDALQYHLQFPRVWLTRGTIVDFPTMYASLYPMTWELLYGAGLALGGPVAAKLLHFSTLPLLAVLVYRTMCRFFPATPPWPAVAFLVSAPTVLWEATTAYVDLALALHAGLVLYALLRFAESENRPWLLLAALQAGLAIATKHLGYFVLLPAVTGLGIFLLRRHGLRRAVCPVALFLAVSLIVAVPWYVRSWVATGNPVFPEFFRLFGAPPDRWDALADVGLNRFKAHFGRPRSFLSLLTLPWDATVHAARYGGTFGPIFLLLLPALLLSPSAAAARRIGMGVLTYVALWASPISSFQMRFLVPVIPPMAVLVAVAYGRLNSLLGTAWPRRGGRVLTAGMAVLVLLNLPPFLPLHEVDRVEWNGWLTHVIRNVPATVVSGRVSADRYLASTVLSYEAWQYVNAHLAEDARVLTFSEGDNLYGERERLWAYAVVARPAVWGAPVGAERQALQALLGLRITHILIDKVELAALPQGSVAIIGADFRRMWLALEYEDRHLELYRIRWENAQTAP